MDSPGKATKQPKLVELDASGWSIKARLALKHRGALYCSAQYLPGLGEIWTRVHLRKFRGRISAPFLLLPEGGVLEDSLAIAQWADQHGSRQNEKLFPPELESQILRWNAACDSILAYGRSTFIQAVLASPELAVGLLPKPLQLFGPLSRLLIRYMLRQVAAKWKDVDQAASLDKIKAEFQKLSDTLHTNGGDFVLGKLTFADLAMAVATSTIEPFGTSLIPGKAFRAPGLEDFRGLIPWRDQILRRPSLQ
ncbi:hypothetical protein ABBQ38_006752 [Trebouxia sp. C0009 RCD-2024]